MTSNDQMNQDELHNDNLEEVAPKLAGLGKKRGYELPEGYFDQLQKEVIERSRQVHKDTHQMRGFVRTMSVAAAVIILMFTAISLWESDVELVDSKEGEFLAASLGGLDGHLRPEPWWARLRTAEVFDPLLENPRGAFEPADDAPEAVFSRTNR